MRKPTGTRDIALRITGALLLIGGLGFVGLLLAYRFDNTTRIFTAVTIERPIDMVFEYVLPIGRNGIRHPLQSVGRRTIHWTLGKRSRKISKRLGGVARSYGL